MNETTLVIRGNRDIVPLFRCLGKFSSASFSGSCLLPGQRRGSGTGVVWRRGCPIFPAELQEQSPRHPGSVEGYAILGIAPTTLVYDKLILGPD